jgi:hypothetical protein
VQVRQPYAGVDFIPQSGIYEFSYCLLSESSPVQNEKLFRIRRAIGIKINAIKVDVSL